MPSKSIEHPFAESQSPSAPQREAIKTSAVDSTRLEEIRVRAFEIYIERGAQPGHDVDDWLQAERELQPNVQPAHAAQ